MRIWLIVFFAGAALVSLHLTVSDLLSETYGDNALIWSDLIGVFFISIAIGLVIGGPLAARYRAPELLFLLCLGSGLLVFMISWLAPGLQKALLAWELGPYASLIVFSTALVLPASILLAAIAPAAVCFYRKDAGQKENSSRMTQRKDKVSSLESREHHAGTREPAKQKRGESNLREPGALRDDKGGAVPPGDGESMKWFIFTLSAGAAAGSFVTLVFLPLMGRWGYLNTIGFLLVGLAFVGLSLHIRFVVACFVGAHFFLAGATYEELIPQEALLGASQFVVEDSQEEESGRFEKKFLTYAEVREKFAELRVKIVAAPDKSIGIKLVADALKNLGNIGISGADFEKVYSELITDPTVLRQTLPFIKRIRLIESDGFGRYYFQIRRVKGSARATLVIPQKSGYIKLLFKSHFTLHFTEKEGDHTQIAIGPRRKVAGGFLSANDSYYTPVIAVDAVGPFDVTLVYLDIYNKPDSVRIEVQGQGFIGGLKKKVIAELKK